MKHNDRRLVVISLFGCVVGFLPYLCLWLIKGKEGKSMPYKFVYKYGHVEIYINGKFYCTADNEDEALREIEEYEDTHACVQI